MRAVVELASFTPFSPTHQAFLDQLTESIGLVLNTIEANTLTENLLKQSQSQARSCARGRRSCAASNEDLGSQASRLAEQNIEVERKNQEVELAKRLVEEKAEQLAVSSQIQVGVHRQHVPRAAHPAQQPVDPRGASSKTTPSRT